MQADEYRLSPLLSFKLKLSQGDNLCQACIKPGFLQTGNPVGKIYIEGFLVGSPPPSICQQSRVSRFPV